MALLPFLRPSMNLPLMSVHIYFVASVCVCAKQLVNAKIYDFYRTFQVPVMAPLDQILLLLTASLSLSLETKLRD